MSTTVQTSTDIRPFHVDTLDEKLAELFSSELGAVFSSLR
jgi:hypothetical protein